MTSGGEESSGSSSSSESNEACAQTPRTQLDRKGDHLMRTPMHTRFMPDAYPMHTRCIPRCSDHVYVAMRTFMRTSPAHTSDAHPDACPRCTPPMHTPARCCAPPLPRRPAQRPARRLKVCTRGPCLASRLPGGRVFLANRGVRCRPPTPGRLPRDGAPPLGRGPMLAGGPRQSHLRGVRRPGATRRMTEYRMPHARCHTSRAMCYDTLSLTCYIVFDRLHDIVYHM